MTWQTNPPFVRQFGPGAEGRDVLAVKAALAAAGCGAGVNLEVDLFGPAAQAQLVKWKRMLELVPLPIYTLQAHQPLAKGGYFSPAGVSELHYAQLVLDDATARDRYCTLAAKTVEFARFFRYSELMGEGPGDRDWWRVAPLRFDGSVLFSCDCSGHAIGVGFHLGFTHPLFGPQQPLFSSDGATGAILGQVNGVPGLAKIPLAQAKRGDWVVFLSALYPAGHHVTILYLPLANGDWTVVNMGGAGEPKFSTLFAELAIQQRLGAGEMQCVQLPTGIAA